MVRLVSRINQKIRHARTTCFRAIAFIPKYLTLKPKRCKSTAISSTESPKSSTIEKLKEVSKAIQEKYYANRAHFRLWRNRRDAAIDFSRVQNNHIVQIENALRIAEGASTDQLLPEEEPEADTHILTKGEYPDSLNATHLKRKRTISPRDTIGPGVHDFYRHYFPNS